MNNLVFFSKFSLLRISRSSAGFLPKQAVVHCPAPSPSPPLTATALVSVHFVPIPIHIRHQVILIIVINYVILHFSCLLHG